MIVSKAKPNTGPNTNDPNLDVSGVSGSNVTSMGSDAHSQNNSYAVEHEAHKVQGENTHRTIVFPTPSPLPVDVRIINKPGSEPTYSESGQEDIKFDHRQPTSGAENSPILGSHPVETQSESLQVEPHISSYSSYEIPLLEGFSESSSNTNYNAQHSPSKTSVSPVWQEVPFINKINPAAPDAQYANEHQPDKCK